MYILFTQDKNDYNLWHSKQFNKTVGMRMSGCKRFQCNIEYQPALERSNRTFRRPSQLVRLKNIQNLRQLMTKQTHSTYNVDATIL